MCVYRSSVPGQQVEKTTSYADVVRGTHKNSSDVADAMRQRVMKGRSKQTGMSGGNLSLLSAN